MSPPTTATMNGNRSVSPAAWGPLFVAAGAALWGLETLWRVFLNQIFLPDVLVFVEHLYCVIFTLPILWWFRHLLKGVPARAWWFLIGSGVLGSAVGTYFFTRGLHHVNLSVANILLNIQPLFSAMYARVLLGERFGRGFFLWALVAMACGVGLSLEKLSLSGLQFNGAVWMILVTALCWSFATVAGRGVNLAMSYRVATPLRFLIGLVSMGGIVAISGHLSPAFLHVEAFSQWHVHQDFLLLSILAGIIPTFLYFRGLGLTPASVASFCEMAQILAALAVTWGFFGQALALHQIVSAGVLLVAVYRINRIQANPLSPGCLQNA